MNSGAIINAQIVTVDKDRRILKDAGILWENTRISAIGSSKEIAAKAKELEITPKDARNSVVFPGMINTHNHIFQHLLKGLGCDMNLEEWWPTVIGPTGVVLREQHVKAATEAAAIEAIRTGTTTIVDYFQVHPVPGLSAVEIETAREMGIRLMYGRGFRNFRKSDTFPDELIDDLDQVFKEVEGLKKQYEDLSDPMLKMYLAPAAAWGLTFDGLSETVKFSKAVNVPITMHVFETDTDNAVCTARYGMKAIDFYERSGLLTPEFIAVHCVKMDDHDISVFKEHDVKISHNPLSNMILSSGVAPVPAFRKAGLTVSIACDGAASNNSNNMLEVLKSTALLHKVTSGDPQILSAYDVLEMATMGGARAIGLENEVGSLEVGKRADMFLFNPVRSATCCPMHDPVAGLVYSSDSRGITMTVINGKVVLEDDVLLGMDEEGILCNEQQQALDLIAKTDFSRACK